MALQGSLDDFSLPDVFQLLSRGKSGALRLRGDQTGIVYFNNGDVYYASSKTGDNLGNALVKSGMVEANVWKAAIAKRGGKQGVGEILLNEKGLDRMALQEFLRERVEEAIFDLLRWEQGHFDFRAGEVHAIGPVFPMQVEPLIAEGRRRLEEWEIIKQSVPSVDAAVRMVRDLPEEHGEVNLTREEWRVLSCIDAKRRIIDVADMLGEGEFKTCQVLHQLVTAGLVEVLEAAEPPAAVEPMVEEIEEEEAEEELEEELLEEIEEEEAEEELEEELDVPTKGLSLAEAAEALEEDEEDEDAVKGKTSGAFEPLRVSGIGDDTAMLDDLLGFGDDSGKGEEASASDDAGKRSAGGKKTGSRRVNTAALAREFSQLWASGESEGSGRAKTRGAAEGRASGKAAVAHGNTAPALDADADTDEVAAALNQAPSPKSGGVNKALIQRLISGVKEL